MKQCSSMDKVDTLWHQLLSFYKDYSWVLKVMGTWIGWEVVSWALLFVQSCKPMMQTLREVANVLLDEWCNFLTLLNVYLSRTACLFLMLSNAHLLICVQLPCCSNVYALNFTRWHLDVVALTCTHLNPMSHSKDILPRSWLLHSCCLRFQLDATTRRKSVTVTLRQSTLWAP